MFYQNSDKTHLESVFRDNNDNNNIDFNNNVNTLSNMNIFKTQPRESKILMNDTINIKNIN